MKQMIGIEGKMWYNSTNLTNSRSANDARGGSNQSYKEVL